MIKTWWIKKTKVIPETYTKFLKTFYGYVQPMINPIISAQERLVRPKHHVKMTRKLIFIFRTRNK